MASSVVSSKIMLACEPVVLQITLMPEFLNPAAIKRATEDLPRVPLI